MAGILASVKRRLAGGAALPLDPRHSDLSLVDYPRSGVTWLSVLVGNMALVASGRPEIATFATSNLYVPDIHVSRAIGDLPYHRPPCRVIKSHAEHRPDYLFVVYLVRHPVAVMKSYHGFLREYGGWTGSFEALVACARRGVPAWKRHVRSWLWRPPGAARLLVLRYEDLMADAPGELDRVSRAFGWEIGAEAIAEAVARSGVEAMAANEAMFRPMKARPGGPFVRRPFEETVPPGLEERVAADCAEELALLGYR